MFVKNKLKKHTVRNNGLNAIINCAVYLKNVKAKAGNILK